MKKYILLFLLAFPLNSFSQISIYATGGISTNTFQKKNYSPNAKMVISPMAEVGAWVNLKQHAFVGLGVRYGQMAVSAPGLLKSSTGADSMGGNNIRHTLVKNMITPMLIFSASFKIKKMSLNTGLEAGFNFNERHRKTSITPVYGIRIDLIQPLGERVGIMGGISADHCSLKDYPGWYFAGKVGVAITLSNNKAIKS